MPENSQLGEVIQWGLLLIGILLAGLVGQHWFQRQRRLGWQETLAPVAERLGLALDGEAAAGDVGGILLTLGPFEVRRPRDDNPRFEQIDLHARIEARPPGLPLDLILLPEGRRSGLALLLQGQDRRLGDVFFDSMVVVGGDEAWLRAVLDAPTRARVLEAIGLGVGVEDGVVTWSGERGVRDSLFLRRMAERVVELAGHLQTPDLRAGLLQVIHTDPQPAVVAGALDVFLRRWLLTDAETADLLEHPQGHVRLVVASTCGPQLGGAVLAALVRDAHEGPDLRAQALTRWAELDPAAAFAAAGGCIPQAPPALVSAALEVLAEAATCPPLATLAPLLATPLRAAVARSLAHSVENAEPHLLELLEDSDEAVAAAAASSLAAQGTAAAVMPLRARARRGGAAVATAAQEAIQAIQAALLGVEGGLSVARSEAGGLALRDEER